MNKHCECAVAGWCKRHQIEKHARHFAYCQGTSKSADCGLDHWLAWEQGRLGATEPANPVRDPEWPCEGGKIVRRDPLEPVTYGDECRVGQRVKKILRERYKITAKPGCLCNRRAKKMDQLGCSGCRDRLDDCVGWLKEGAAERVWLRPLVTMFGGTVDQWARKLVAEAITLEELAHGYQT